MEIADLLEELGPHVGPDRDLDRDIWVAITPGATVRKWSYVHEATGTVCNVVEERVSGGALVNVPHYTSSFDAAATLVPDGFVWSYAPTRFVPHLAIVKLDYAHGGFDGNSDHSGPLALCIAALKARAAGPVSASQ